MAEAARSARGAFGDIRSGAGEMAVGVSKGSIDVRHSLGLVDNVIRGAHAQAMADLVRMYAQSALVMNTLPIAAAVAGLALIGGIAYEAANHIKKMKEEAEKLSNSLTSQNTVGNNVFRHIGDQILKAEERTDELTNNHLGALKIELELIDHQSMDELVKSFDMVEKAADSVFKLTAAHWYTFGSGSEGASHALDQFKLKYDNLLSQGKDKEASDLLHGTLSSAQQILQAQQTMNTNRTGTGLFGPDLKDPEAYYDAMFQLRQRGVGYTKTETEAQQALVTALQQQAGIESRVNELKNLDSSNARGGAAKEAAQRRAAAAKEAASAQLSMGESAVAGEKAAADAQLAIHNATLEQRLASDLDFANRDYQVKEAANQAEIAALNKTSNDYQAQLKTLKDKALEIEQQYDTQIADLKGKAAIAINARDIQALEQGIREQIDSTREGSAARLAAVNAGIREEQARQQQNSSFYRELMTQRVSVARQMAEAQAQAAQEAANESAGHDLRMGNQRVASQKQANDLYNSGHHMSRAKLVKQQQDIANEEYANKMAALEKQIDGLNKSGKDYENRLKALQDRETELTQSHENELTAIKDKSTEQRNQKLLSAEQRYENSIAQGLTSVLMRHQTFAQMMTSLGNEVVSGLLGMAMKNIEANLMTKESDAAAAARKMFLAGAEMPFPANIVAAPALAAGAFASVMAFESGTEGVPGVGRGDIVPALLTPGEGVVPGGVMDGLRNMARSGGFSTGGTQIHIHGVHYAPKVHAMDAEGVDRVLTKHQSLFQNHFDKAIRKINR